MILTALQSVTFLARFQQDVVMGGITKAQALRKKYGLVVSHTIRDGKPYCDVVKEGAIAASYRDDYFATGSKHIFDAIYTEAMKDVPYAEKFADMVCSQFDACFNVRFALAQFDQQGFEALLPDLKGVMFAGVEKRYASVVFDGDEWECYNAYDWIASTFSIIRELGVVVASPITDARPVLEVLGNLSGCRVFDISGAGAFVGALESLYPGGVVRDHGGRKYFLADSTQSALVLIGGVPLEFTVNSEWLSPSKGDKGRKEDRVKVSVEVIADEDDLAAHAQRVAALLPQAPQSLTHEEQEYTLHGGVPDMLDRARGVGKTALKGFGQTVGEGPLDECIVRLAQSIKKKVGNRFTFSECVSFSAGRIARMQSAKEVVSNDGVLCLLDRQ